MTEYIEREAISEKIRKYYYKNPPNSSYGEGFDRGLDRAQRAILDAPAADVAPVRLGRWEPYFEEVEIYNAGGVAERKQTGWICGRCKSVESITRYYKTNYCPNCGARMDEVK